MGSYEIIVKTEEMRRKTRENDYVNAQRILDTMDIKKIKNIKNISDLSLIAEIYSKNARFDECNEILLRIYERTRSRKVVYQLLTNAIDRSDIKDCEMYMEEYREIAPKDFYIHIFQYQIAKLKGEPYELLMEPLKELKKTEYIEQWVYELAKLYYKAGMEEECIKECSEIILWFGEGIYVEKAKVLKSYYSGEKDKDKLLSDLKNRAMNTIPISYQKVQDQLKKQQEQAKQEQFNDSSDEDATETKDYDIHISSLEKELSEEVATALEEDEEDALPSFMKKDVQWDKEFEDEVEQALYRLLDEDSENNKEDKHE